MSGNVISENYFKFKEVRSCENFSNYTGDNDKEKCYFLNENEYVVAKQDTEVFAPLEKDETIITAVKDDNRLVVRGDVSALNGFALLYELGYLTDSQIYIFSNNNFDLDLFKKTTSEINPDLGIMMDDYSDSDYEISLDVKENMVNVSTGYGDIYSYELNSVSNNKRK
jgi:hypothetical protein